MTDAILPLILSALAIMGSPGPSTISLTAVTATFGARRALPYFAGLVIGTTLVLVAVAAGVTVAILAVPYTAAILSVAASIYILYLAWQIATAPPLGSAYVVAGNPPPAWGGVILGVANPKAWVAIGAVFAAYRVAVDQTADAILKTAILTVLIVAIHAAWLGAGALFAEFLRDPVRSRIANIAMAILLVVTAVGALIPHSG